jgi:D-alanyl-lipoteichoic acid acyltransferase DltB (MBOAT superfamily)
MLFNSYSFLFVFLPLALLGYQLAGYFHRKAVVAWLGLMSLAFYAYWRPMLVVLLVSSIAVNYLAAVLISREVPGSSRSRLWMWLAIGIDIGALGYFKYLFPFLNFASSAAGSPHRWANVILPLGISFFTFTQIAYLVDLQQGIATRQDIASYVLFVTFFPHLIAGPILHHKEMMPQFNQNRRYRLRLDDLSVGFSWFIMGLAKKVLLADIFAETANKVFAMPEGLSGVTAWRGVLSFALQLYFDFSGYSDMALGLARMFSINFPLNFSSPYKATNIIDFWQRWHITLTQYITAYLYSPVQMIISRRRQEQGKKVSRKALATPEGFANMIAVPTLFTMFIAGVWHGAGLQYIVFGLLHGIYITINHAWRVFGPKPKADRSQISKNAGHVSAVLITFVAVLVADVFFRAASTGRAVSMLGSMAGLHGMRLRELLPGESGLTRVEDLIFMAAGFAIVWSLPNTQQILGRFKPALEITPWDEEPAPRRLLWYPKLAWGVGMGCVFFLVLVFLQDPSTFLYFQF